MEVNKVQIWLLGQCRLVKVLPLGNTPILLSQIPRIYTEICEKK